MIVYGFAQPFPTNDFDGTTLSQRGCLTDLKVMKVVVSHLIVCRFVRIRPIGVDERCRGGKFSCIGIRFSLECFLLENTTRGIEIDWVVHSIAYSL